jgi:hypothetical protein
VALHLTPAPGVVHRVGLLPEPFSWRLPVADLVRIGSKPELAGGRWDAPASEFATLYCADAPVIAFVESISPFRPVPGYEEAILAATNGDPPDPEFDHAIYSGRLPATYFEPLRATEEPTLQGRALGQADLTDGELVDVSHPDTHHELNGALGELLKRYGFDRFDRGVMMSQDRRISRQVAAHLHASTKAVGISYECRFSDGTCFALWERAKLTPGDVRPVTNRDPDLRHAAELLHITMTPRN